MGTVSIFVLLCKVVYLVNLCSSAVIDFEKEREELCAMAGIKDRKCTESENILIKEGVKRKQEIENERDLQKKLIENERDLRKQAEDQKNEYFNRTVKAEEQKETETKSKKKIGIIYYYRVRIDHLQWLVTEDETVQNLMKNIDRNKILIPTGIDPDGQESYKSRFHVWKAVAQAMQNTANTYILEIKKVFENAGIDTSKIDHVASIAAILFNKMSGEAKKDDVEYNDEEEVVEALKDWRIKDEEQLKLARAIYRLNL